MKKFVYLLSIVAAFVFAPALAFAADAVVAAPATFELDLKPLINELIAAMGAVLSVLGVAGIAWIQRKFKMDGIVKQEILKDAMDKAASRATAYAVAQLKQADWTTIKTKNEVVAHAVDFINKNAPDIVQKLKLDEDSVKDYIQSKLVEHDEAPGTFK